MHHLRAGLFACSAKASAIFNASDERVRERVFVVTATTSPRSGKVMNDVEPPMRIRRRGPPSASFARERNSLEVPAKAVTGLLARGQPLWRLEHLDGGGLQQLAAVDRHPEAHQVGRRGQERAGSREAGIVALARQSGP